MKGQRQVHEDWRSCCVLIMSFNVINPLVSGPRCASCSPPGSFPVMGMSIWWSWEFQCTGNQSTQLLTLNYKSPKARLLKGSWSLPALQLRRPAAQGEGALKDSHEGMKVVLQGGLETHAVSFRARSLVCLLCQLLEWTTGWVLLAVWVTALTST